MPLSGTPLDQSNTHLFNPSLPPAPWVGFEVPPLELPCIYCMVSQRVRCETQFHSVCKHWHTRSIGGIPIDRFNCSHASGLPTSLLNPNTVSSAITNWCFHGTSSPSHECTYCLRRESPHWRGAGHWTLGSKKSSLLSSFRCERCQNVTRWSIWGFWSILGSSGLYWSKDSLAVWGGWWNFNTRISLRFEELHYSHRRVASL